MRRFHPTWVLIVVVLLALPRPSAAVGDLDLLAAGIVEPNVMLVLDNSGSMESSLGGSTRIEVAGQALLGIVDDLYPDDGSGGYTATVRLGLARFDPSGGKAGGDIVEPISSTNKSSIIASINQTVADRLAPGASGTGTLLSETLVDVGRYFAGQHGFGSYPAVGNTSPIDLTCRDNFVVFISDGEPKDDENNHYGSFVAGTTAYSAFVNTIGNADGDLNECSLASPPDPYTCIDAPKTGRDDGLTYTNNGGTDWFDDVAFHLANTDLVPDSVLTGDQTVATYTIGFTVNHPLLSETAVNGGGEYFIANNSADLSTSLQNSFNSIFEKLETSFNSAVVPGASIGQGNALFNSFFESSDEPVWEGHLEALRISSAGEIQDKNLDPAVDSVTGELLDTRVPFWDSADRIQSQTSRTLYTTLAGSRGSFDTSLTATDLDLTLGEATAYPNYPTSGVDTLAELEDAVVLYVHGKDAFDEDGDSDATEMRDVVFGDIFHSEPRSIGVPTRLTITEPGYLAFYNAYKDRNRVIYAGANDGMLHAIDAGAFVLGDNIATPELETSHYTYGIPTDAEGGEELWGYVPGHLLDKVKLLPRNSPRTEYFVDGPISVVDAWLGDGTGTDITKTADEWATVLISGYREGGSGYLALDITDPSATSGDDHFPYPALLWEFDDADLGESWSEAIITRVKLEGAFGDGDKCGIPDGDGDCREQWVAIFGGGYAADGDPNRSTYIDDPTDAGWSDTDVDPQIDNWPVGVFFRTDPVTVAGSVEHYRSFFFPPVGSLQNGTLTLAFGSGERHDLAYPGDGSVADENRFYITKDSTPFGTGAFATTLTDASLTDITSLDTDTNPLDGGFRFDVADGEKFVTNITVFAGFVIVGSYTPVSSANVCQTASGQSFLHVFKLDSGKGFYDDPSDPPSEDRRTFVGGGLPSDPTVTVSDDPNDDTILIKTSEGPTMLSLDAPPRNDPAGSLIYWRQQL